MLQIRCPCQQRAAYDAQLATNDEYPNSFDSILQTSDIPVPLPA
jgi:hypothetical protein